MKCVECPNPPACQCATSLCQSMFGQPEHALAKRTLDAHLEFLNSLPVPVVHAVASMSSDLISRDLAAHVLAASTVMVHISKIWAIFFQRSQRFSTLSMARVAVPPKLPQTASRRMHIDRLHWHQSNRLHELSTTICDSRTAVPIRSSYHTQGMH